MTKDTLDLMAAVQRAYHKILRLQQEVEQSAILGWTAEAKANSPTAGPYAVTPTTLLQVDEAYDVYDALIDDLVEQTDGEASAVNTDPLTFHHREYKDKTMSFNSMLKRMVTDEFKV